MTRLHRGQPGWWDTCEALGEHKGEATAPYLDDDGNTVQRWKCCGDVDQVKLLCTCHMLPPHMWETYGGAVEPGSMVEPDPDCAACYPDTARN